LVKNGGKNHQQNQPSAVSYQGGEFEVMTLQDALVAYRTYARAEGKSPKTIAWINFSVGYFTDFLGLDQQDIATITGNDLRRFIIALREKQKWSNHPYLKSQAKLSPQSIETYCRGIRALFGFLYREGFIDTNPMAKVKMPSVPETVVPTLSEKDIAKLLAQPNKNSNQGFRDYGIMLTFIDTTLRLSELADLKVDGVDYEQNLLRVMGKGKKERYVPFGHKVAKVLMKYQQKHRPQPVGTDNFWLRFDGKPLSPGRIQKLFTHYAKKAGLKRVYPHLMRHSSSVLYLRYGGDPFTLQRKLGHKTLTMTRHYSQLADTDVRDSHLRYSPADRLKI
jgi:site-specific recombinase XerD